MERREPPNMALKLLSTRTCRSHHGFVRDVTSKSETENGYADCENCLEPIHLFSPVRFQNAVGVTPTALSSLVNTS
jgi:hypothetical protein